MEDVVMVDVEELEDDIIDVETLEEVTGSEDKTVTWTDGGNEVVEEDMKEDAGAVEPGEEVLGGEEVADIVVVEVVVAAGDVEVGGDGGFDLLLVLISSLL